VAQVAALAADLLAAEAIRFVCLLSFLRCFVVLRLIVVFLLLHYC